MPKIIGNYYNWVDVFYDMKKEGEEAFKERLTPPIIALAELPKGWISATQVADDYGLDDIDARILVSRNGGKNYRIGGRPTSAAPIEKVMAALKKIGRDKKVDKESFITMYEAARWSGISRRTLDRTREEMEIETHIVYRGQAQRRMVRKTDVVEMAKYLCQHSPNYYQERLNSFLIDNDDGTGSW